MREFPFLVCPRSAGEDPGWHGCVKKNSIVDCSHGCGSGSIRTQISFFYIDLHYTVEDEGGRVSDEEGKMSDEGGKMSGEEGEVREEGRGKREER